MRGERWVGRAMRGRSGFLQELRLREGKLMELSDEWIRHDVT